LAPVSSFGAVVSWEEVMARYGEAKAVLGSYYVASAEGMVRLVAA